MSSTTVIWPTTRRDYTFDSRGNLTFHKRQNEVRKLILNWADELPIRVSGSTISSVAYEDHGTTRTLTANSTTTTTDYVTGSGYFKITVTFANTEKIERTVRFVASDGDEISDYR